MFASAAKRDGGSTIAMPVSGRSEDSLRDPKLHFPPTSSQAEGWRRSSCQECPEPGAVSDSDLNVAPFLLRIRAPSKPARLECPSSQLRRSTLTRLRFIPCWGPKSYESYCGLSRQVGVSPVRLGID
ncbi:hypothetical protein VUR80DRAFT_4310 [Thermomyces stellatus]